jgi:nicotinamidase-related amidase
MPVVGKGPEIDKSALIIVDMQNDFLHRESQPHRSGASRSQHRYAVFDRHHSQCQKTG